MLRLNLSPAHLAAEADRRDRLAAEVRDLAAYFAGRPEDGCVLCERRGQHAPACPCVTHLGWAVRREGLEAEWADLMAEMVRLLAGPYRQLDLLLEG